jgi:hypothetical protein
LGDARAYRIRRDDPRKRKLLQLRRRNHLRRIKIYQPGPDFPLGDWVEYDAEGNMSSAQFERQRRTFRHAKQAIENKG